jgi:hypothetical protein
MQHTIAGAVRATNPRTKERMQALTTVRWMLATEDGRFVAVDKRAQTELVRDPAKATVYDGRDNEKLKQLFFEAILSLPLSVVLLDT